MLDPVDTLRARIASLEAERDRLAEVLRTLSDLCARNLPPDVLMTDVVEQVQRLTRGTGAVLEVVDGEDLIYRTASGTIVPFLGLRLAAANSLSGRCVQFREIMYSPDTSQDPRVDQTACRAVQARSMLVVPLLHGNRAVGVLKATSTSTDAFDAIDEQALRLSAGVLAGLLARAGVSGHA